tara:strand:+ start:592 stop:816 length:225 start_codon:yes stop_codon:yes gene_type:complete
MVYQKKTLKTENSELGDLMEYLDGLEKFQDRMYRHYLDEKQIYQETDVLSKKEYLEKYKQFLIEKLKEENLNDR